MSCSLPGVVDPAKPSARSWRRRVAGLVLLLGALVVGAQLFSASGRQVDVTLVVQVPADVTRVDATLRLEGDPEPLARLAGTPQGGQLRHAARLPPGSYQVEVSLEGEGPARVQTRRAQVVSDAVITLDCR
jgi:hypothetical protein